MFCGELKCSWLIVFPQDNRISLVDYVVSYYLRNFDEVRNDASVVVLR